MGDLRMKLFSTVAFAFSHTAVASPARSGKECVTKDGEYFGKELSETKSGYKCRTWADIRPPLKSVDQFEEDHNYCRNPEVNGKKSREHTKKCCAVLIISSPL